MISAEKCKDIVKINFGLWSVNFSAMNPPKGSIINVMKQSDDEAPVMLELWGIRSTTLLLSLPSPYYPEAETCDRILSMSQIVIFDIYLCTHAKLN